jgi:hypothetical protein
VGPADQPDQRDPGAGGSDRAQQIRDPRASLSEAGDAPSGRLFRFAQIEVPWPLGPPEGRYLLRTPGHADGPPSHVLIFATLGAVERRRLARRRRTEIPTQPDPVPVATGRATLIDAEALDGAGLAQQWLEAAGEPQLEEALHVLNRALHAFRVVSADPYLHEIARGQLLAARIGYGAGEEVAEGRWTRADELLGPPPPRRRSQVLTPQARLASVLGAREAALASEELVLRARRDLDNARPREAALQVLIALDAALAELGRGPRAEALSGRLGELEGQREAVTQAAQAALDGDPSPAQLQSVTEAVERLEAALRARAARSG